MADQHTNPNDTAVTEATYLKREAERAKLAMRKALGEAGANLMHGVDPRGWAKDHPWWSLLGASVAGFTAACAVVPSEEQRALKRLRAIDRALRAKERAAHAKDHPEDKDDRAAKKAAKGSFGAIIAAEAIKMLRPVLMSSLSAFTNRGNATNGTADDQHATAADPAPGYSAPT